MAIPKKKDEENLKPNLHVVHHSAADHEDDDDHDPLVSHKKGEEGEGPWLVSYADLMTLLMGFFALIASFSKPDQKEFEKVKQAASQYFGGEYQEPYKKLEENLKRVVKENKLSDQVKISSDAEGVVLTFTGSLFFDSGQFEVKDTAKPVLDKMADAIKKDSAKYHALIEGHTDDRPISHPIIASNWELSGIRASRIALLFEAKGFSKSQLHILGLGETKPIAPNSNPDGTPNLENQTKNRRVIIRVFNNELSPNAAEEQAQSPTPPAAHK